jgi:hypothetical protein
MLVVPLLLPLPEFCQCLQKHLTAKHTTKHCASPASITNAAACPAAPQSLAFVLGIDMSRIRIARVVPGSVVLDFDILEDPLIANAPIPAPVVDTSNNVDPSTAAELAQLPADQQQAQLQQYFNTSTSATATADMPAGSTTTDSSNGASSTTADGSSSAGGSSSSDPNLGLTGNVTATVAAGQELLAVLAKLQGAAASGNLSQSLGVEVLSMTARVL